MANKNEADSGNRWHGALKPVVVGAGVLGAAIALAGSQARRRPEGIALVGNVTADRPNPRAFALGLAYIAGAVLIAGVDSATGKFRGPVTYPDSSGQGLPSVSLAIAGQEADGSSPAKTPQSKAPSDLTDNYFSPTGAGSPIQSSGGQHDSFARVDEGIF